MSAVQLSVGRLPHGSALDGALLARARSLFVDAFTKAYTPFLGKAEGMPSTVADLKLFLDEAFTCDARDLAQSNGETVAYVVTGDNKLVGYLSVDVDPEGDWLYLRQLAVCPHTQRSGAGRLVVHRSLEDHERAREIRVSLRKVNSPALHFYTALGFKPAKECHTSLDDKLYCGLVLHRN